MAMTAAVLAVVVDRMVVARDSLEGQKLGLRHRARGQRKGLAQLKLVKVAARRQAMPLGIEGFTHGLRPRRLGAVARGLAAAASPPCLATSAACRWRPESKSSSMYSR